MARPNQEAIDTFISITGATEAVAEQKLLDHGGDLNEAVNAHFSEGDRNILANVRPVSAANAEDDFMDVDDPVEVVEPWGPRLPLHSSSPFSLLDPSFRRGLFDGVSELTNSGPFVSHPRQVRQIPIEVNDVDRPSGVGPIIEDVTETLNVTETVNTRGTENHGTVIIDDEEDEVPAVLPSAPRSDGVQDFGNDIEEQMIQAAIEASKREVAESFPSQPFSVESGDVSNLGSVPRQPPLEDDEIARAVSLSLKAAEKEKALRGKESDVGESSRGAPKPEDVELGNIGASNGRSEAGKSLLQDEVEDTDEEPLVRHRSRRMSSGSVDSAKDAGVIEDSPPLSPRIPNRSASPEPNGDAFQSEDWGGLSSLEHDEAVMLEAAMFGGIPESSGFRFPYASGQHVQQPGGPYLRRFRPPSPSLTAQRLIREQQDDEYLASLQADREKEQKAREEELARLEEERRKEEESLKQLEEEKELERRLEAKEAALPHEPASDDENAMTLLVRMPDGTRRGRRFLKSDKLQCLFDFIDVGRAVKPGSYRLVRPYPRRAFEDGESGLTLNELGLTSKQEALYLELI